MIKMLKELMAKVDKYTLILISFMINSLTNLLRLCQTERTESCLFSGIHSVTC